MKMIVLYVIMMIVTFFILAKTTITFSPFSIKCEETLTAIGWIMLLVGASLLSYDSNRIGRVKAGKEIKQELFQQLEKMTKELKTIDSINVNKENENNNEQSAGNLEKSI